MMRELIDLLHERKLLIKYKDLKDRIKVIENMEQELSDLLDKKERDYYEKNRKPDNTL